MWRAIASFAAGTSRAHATVRLLLCLVVVVAAGCDASNPAAPSSQGQAPASVLRDGSTQAATVALRGLVTDMEGAPLAGAFVGGWDVHGYWMTDDAGRFEIPKITVGRTVGLAAEKPGFTTRRRQVVVTGDDADFKLERADPIVHPDQYQVTITASPACSLPANAMTRQYTATIDEVDGRVIVALHGAVFSVWGEPGFEGSREGDRVRFFFTDDSQADYQFVELIGSNQELAFLGSADGVVSPDRIVANFTGRITVRHWSGHTNVAACQSTGHRLELRRQASAAR